MKLVLFLLMLFVCSCSAQCDFLKKVHVDFSGASDQHIVLTFKGNDYQGIYVFDSNNGQDQTQYLPSTGTYILKYELIPVNPNSCQYILDNMFNPGTGGVRYDSAAAVQGEYEFSVNCR